MSEAPTDNTEPVETLPQGNTEPAETPPETETTDEGGFEIDGQKFKTQEEAFNFYRKQVQDREAELAVQQARAEGFAEAAHSFRSPPAQAAAAPEPTTEEWEQEFYTNPKVALEKMRSQIADEIQNKIHGKLSAAETEKQVWNDFTTAHPYLADFRPEVEMVANQNAEVVMALMKSKGNRAAFDFVARKVQERAELMKEAVKPKKEMPRTSTTVTPSSQNGVTQPPKKEEKLDFVSQVNKLRRERMGY